MVYWWTLNFVSNQEGKYTVNKFVVWPAMIWGRIARLFVQCKRNDQLYLENFRSFGDRELMFAWEKQFQTLGDIL